VTGRPPVTPALLKSGVVAILRGRTAEHVDRVADVLTEEGIACLELTFTTPYAIPALRRLRERHPSVAVGAGTVCTVDQARAALDAGAAFLASPMFVDEILSLATSRNVPCYLGAFTPTEVWHAWQSGTSAIKLFPASTGGISHLRELRAPLPDIKFLPTGGISLDDISRYLDAGAIGVGLGSSLIGDALDGGDLSELRSRVRRVRETVRRRDDGGR
jgi:2-dehydro-3-deoxyphosphogluconate aldolase / (4S)-4-hydroxy-2-oxoglutarate aldolase